MQSLEIAYRVIQASPIAPDEDACMKVRLHTTSCLSVRLCVVRIYIFPVPTMAICRGYIVCRNIPFWVVLRCCDSHKYISVCCDLFHI